MARPSHGRSLTPEALALVAGVFRTLGDPLRLRLLQTLQGGERSVSELAAAVGGTQPNVSKHLRVLQEAGLVSRRQERTLAFYAIADELAWQLCDLVCTRMADRLDAQVAELRGGPSKGKRR